MSVKPIQDELEVKEVGNPSDANRGQIDSQTLPLPPMTVNQFQDFVSNVVEDIMRVDKPVDNVVVSQLGPETQKVDFDSLGPVNTPVTETSGGEAISSETPVPEPPPEVLDSSDKAEMNPQQELNDLEGRVASLLAKIGSVVQTSGGGASGLTTRDYVDNVLGGERNLEGEKLVEVGNFLGEDEGVRFSQNEDGTFNITKDDELIQENITQEAANDWITAKEQGDSVKGSPEEESQETKTDGTETEGTGKDGKIIQETDNTTTAHRPFHFDPNYMIYASLSSSTFKEHLYDILAENASNGYWYIEGTVNSSLEVTECAVKFDKGFTAHDMEGYCTYEENSYEVQVQTKFELPIATEFDGEINLISTGGFYEPVIYCLSGKPTVYLTKIS